MEGSLPVKQKKQPPIPTMGQELRSCDTTQIDEKFVRSLMRTIIRTPIDNGRDPVGIYSSKRFFKPPSEVHSFRTDDRDLTTHGSLNNGFPELLLFVTGLMLAL